MSNQKWAKIMAILALLWIIVSVVWTSILYIVEKQNEKTQEQILEEMIKKYSNSWSGMDIQILTWSLNNSWSLSTSWTWNLN